ncbi:glutamate-1-semialdehyde 2,1-aminomutase [Pelosinus fermentans]|uniref:glutamate-1-semialdehyde 2,1-aminomutase n=1 Tax=Pelosinus fermentans TaxID=365349 RepID=UPI0002685C29|nr:glutamate-1-semialdehyde 2,1-aminomutase [Pelosinus fermentans]OAM92783.1 Glutamate-1-semialdehyde 2,1-aminomutase [Pelosinus fermentans DSM 17108]SDQ56710.1 glutamate-1-semialdehyde 2,1-aminomutase [Pelosinus fermentans]
MKFDESDHLRIRAQKIIPAGAHTYSKGDDQFPQLSPGFIVKGKGTKVWDPDGNEFLDWGMGLRSVSLGHAYQPVLDAVQEQIALGVNFTRPSILEAQIAEMLINLIPSAEMVKFAKNGSDVTTAAVKLARAYTGRDIVVRCAEQPFFSVNDWFIGDTACNAGIPKAVQNLTTRFSYNNIQSLEDIMEKNKGEVACVILEPSSLEHPKPGFLEKVRELTKQQGIVLIFDEMITGFRWHQAGAQTYYGVTPDLSTFGKAIANGFALSALVGRRDIMELGGLKHDKPRVFLLSTTNGGETHAFAAARVTMQTLLNGEIVKQNWKKGQRLSSEFNAISAEYGIVEYVRMAGVACSPYQIFLGRDGQVDLSLRTLYLQEMIQQGVLIPYIAIAHEHSEHDIDKTLEASRKAMKVLQQALEKGTTDGLLVGPAVKPVFRKYN